MVADKKNAQNVLRRELEKIASQDFEEIWKIAQKGIEPYEVGAEGKTYQIGISFDIPQDQSLINVMGTIDGPGVRHF